MSLVNEFLIQKHIKLCEAPRLDTEKKKKGLLVDFLTSCMSSLADFSTISYRIYDYLDKGQITQFWSQYYIKRIITGYSKKKLDTWKIRSHHVKQ